MEWDLYLDESGSFKYAKEPTLIGGFLVPHANAPTRSGFQKWRSDIRSRIRESGVYGADDLKRGDEYHVLQKKPTKNEAQTKQFNEIIASRFYVFDHCSENPGSNDRSIAQAWGLQEYMKKLAAVGGRPVLFMNPDGVYHVDSNTTFMSIFANGIVRLYNELRQQAGTEITKLNIHAASRLNVTRKQETKLYSFSPVAGTEDVLDRTLYLNQVRNCVLLNGGSDLLALKAFQESLESFEIIVDEKINGEYCPHPATVVCDYICNSALNMTRNENYKNILTNAGSLIYNVFGEPIKLSGAVIERMVQEHKWAAYMVSLFSNDFPEEGVKEYFERLDSARGYNQKKCVNELVEYLYPFVDNRENMPLLVTRIKKLIQVGKEYREDAAVLLEANLRLYLIALYTHMAQEKEIRESQIQFTDCVSHIRDYQERDELLLIFCNRQIVTDTDSFLYQSAHSWFEAIQNHSSKSLSNSDDLMTDFTLLVGREEEPAASVSVQYGKAIGSCIQLLSKELRNATGEEREKLLEQAEAMEKLAFNHLLQPQEAGRAHQNLCDLMTEERRFEDSVLHLYLALDPRGELNDFKDRAAYILESTGYSGKKHSMPFPYLHYVYAMHRALRTGDPHGQELLELLTRQSISYDSVSHLVKSPHPQAVIAWHLAASLAVKGGYQKMAKQLMEEAANTLLSAGSELFTTIGMAVQAEMIALGLEGKLEGPEKDWKQKAERYFSKAWPSYDEQTDHNPYKKIFEDAVSNHLTSTVFYRLADNIPY